MGRYQVMHLDFSQVGGTIDELEKKIDKYLGFMLNAFVRKYADDYPEYFVEEFFKEECGTNKLVMITSVANELRIPMYLIIDEYDNFTNIVLSEKGEEVYHKMTHAEGFYRDVFKKFKGTFERIFFTGVSPVTLDDLTSGFNIGWNISTLFYFNNMLGFSTEEVREMFTYYKEAGSLPANFDIEAMIEEMRPWYDNYCFSKECLKDGNRKGVLKQIAEKGEITSNIELSFPASELIKPNKFISLLFYYGMLTIKGVSDLQLVLAIPNNNVRMQYYSFLMENYDEVCSVDTRELVSLYSAMGAQGNWYDALQYLCDRYKLLSSVRDSIEGERNIQGFFMAYLSLCSYYIIAPEMEFSHGYCDLFLMPNMAHYKAKHSYIIELKYLSKANYTEDAATKQWGEAVEQINRYAAAPRVEALRQGTQLHKIIIQFCGWEVIRMEEI